VVTQHQPRVTACRTVGNPNTCTDVSSWSSWVDPAGSSCASLRTVCQHAAGAATRRARACLAAMPSKPLSAEALASATADFEANGAVIFRDALEPAEVQLLRDTFSANRRAKPLNWTLRGTDRSVENGPTGESGRWQTDELLRTDTEAVALVARHPLLMQLASELIGPSARFQGINAMWREPVQEDPPSTVPPAYAAAGIHWQLWHREGGGAHAPTHPRCIPSLQCIFYLDACDATSHCFSYVPESIEQKQALPIEPISDSNAPVHVKRDSPTGSDQMWTNRPLEGRAGWPSDLGTGVDVLGPAGTLIVLNNNNLHAGTVRGPTDRPRRTLHVQCAYLSWCFAPEPY
jgi:hypothetical protein